MFCSGSTRPRDVLYLKIGMKMQYICVREMRQINVESLTQHKLFILTAKASAHDLIYY